MAPLSLSLSPRLYICLFVYLSISRVPPLSLATSIYLSVCLSYSLAHACPSLSLSPHLSIYLSVYLSLSHSLPTPLAGFVWDRRAAPGQRDACGLQLEPLRLRGNRLAGPRRLGPPLRLALHKVQDARQRRAPLRGLGRGAAHLTSDIRIVCPNHNAIVGFTRICIYLSIYIYIYLFIHVYIYKYIYICVCVCM